MARALNKLKLGTINRVLGVVELHGLRLLVHKVRIKWKYLACSQEVRVDHRADAASASTSNISAVGLSTIHRLITFFE